MGVQKSRNLNSTANILRQFYQKRICDFSKKDLGRIWGDLREEEGVSCCCRRRVFKLLKECRKAVVKNYSASRPLVHRLVGKEKVYVKPCTLQGQTLSRVCVSMNMGQLVSYIFSICATVLNTMSSVTLQKGGWKNKRLLLCPHPSPKTGMLKLLEVVNLGTYLQIYLINTVHKLYQLQVMSVTGEKFLQLVYASKPTLSLPRHSQLVRPRCENCVQVWLGPPMLQRPWVIRSLLAR